MGVQFLSLLVFIPTMFIKEYSKSMEVCVIKDSAVKY